MRDELRLTRVLKDGRILAINTWVGGFQEVVFRSRSDFDRAKREVEQEGKVLNVAGYTSVK